MSFIPGSDMPVDQAASVNAEPNAAEALSSRDLPSDQRKWRPTSDFPADPSLPLPRRELEDHYRKMRCSHEFLVRSRAQLKRRFRETKNSRQNLLDTIRHYEEEYDAIGRERIEQFEIARELKQKLEAFERDQQDLDQLLSQVEEVHGKGGFWSFLKVTQLLKRMRELFLSSGIRQ